MFLFNYEQAEHDAGGGASGGISTQNDGAAPEAGADGAQAGQGGDTASQPDGTGKTSQEPTAEQYEITWNGQKVKMSRQEVIDNAQRAYNVTQREQELSKTRKELAAKLARLDELVAEAEKAGRPEEPEANDPINKISKEVEELRTKAQIQEWEKAFNPVQQKYPDISEKILLTEFQEKVQSGDVEDSAAGLMKVAESIANEREGTVGKRLEGLLKDPNNPKMKAYNEKLIADYVAGKIKLANAGGEPGGTSAGAKPDANAFIAEVAAKLRG